MARYFLISQVGEATEATVYQFSDKKELGLFIEDASEDGKPEFVDLVELEVSPDPADWDGYLIIRGEIVKPKERKVVTEWEF